MVRTYTARLELADDPDELLRALEAVTDDRGTLRSVSYDRRDVTPRGKVVVELTIEAEPDRFRSVAAEWERAGVEVVRAEREQNTASVTVLVDGGPTGTALTETLAFVSEESHVSVSELSWTAADGASARSCTRLHVVADPAADGDPLEAIRRFAREHTCRIVD
jgi:ACT domain-containing protein